ncbi:hypothetical protein SCLCIDRAFT_1219450 [Scleroderma citrinum Foug A]|uniref:Uncharacterized protein n=1 Tax=Scleroderma citrinum Foug A TaxID=1036808 RepID=A0A0C3DMZ3_9AGAM|nr:hypothetical protein SCLCIDRAFT_1219450 [Scleroderma citrinum Foug A]
MDVRKGQAHGWGGSSDRGTCCTCGKLLLGWQTGGSRRAHGHMRVLSKAPTTSIIVISERWCVFMGWRREHGIPSPLIAPMGTCAPVHFHQMNQLVDPFEEINRVALSFDQLHSNAWMQLSGAVVVPG